MIRTPLTQNARLASLARAGVSVWLDDLSRDLIESGRLLELTRTRSVSGVTTNPAIFQAALSDGDTYAGPVRDLAQSGATADDVVRSITTDDVRRACDVLTPAFTASDGVDGRVSIEVDPRLAHDTDATVEQAIDLWHQVARPNVMIKIPATRAGLPAITRVLAQGISVNVTLIFSVERYVEVIDAYLDGLDAAHQAGHNLSRIHSVASFFISRVDTEVDARLDAIGSSTAHNLRGRAGLANARLAYAAFQNAFERDPRFARIAALGARPQRPLWASTGTKNPAYPDTLYVSELVAPHTVNTMPGGTMEAFAGHGWVNEQSIVGTADSSQAVFDALRAVGVDLDAVFAKLESEGVAKFEQAWEQLLAATAEQIAAAPV